MPSVHRLVHPKGVEILLDVARWGLFNTGAPPACNSGQVTASKQTEIRRWANPWCTSRSAVGTSRRPRLSSSSCSAGRSAREGKGDVTDIDSLRGDGKGEELDGTGSPSRRGPVVRPPCPHPA